MTEIYSLATLWVGLALLATLLSIWLRIAWTGWLFPMMPN